MAAQGQVQIALDGKTLRRSHDGVRDTALHSITAWGHECGLVLAQEKSSGKKNEQASVLAMLDMLQVKGAHITAELSGWHRGYAGIGAWSTRHIGKKNSMRGKLKQAGWSDTRRAEILFGQPA